MATARTRKARGAQTQTAVANYFRNTIYPYAESAGAGRGGRDVLNTPRIAVEVKARRDLDPLAWLRQVQRASDTGDLPMVVFRPDGLGLVSVDSWPVLMTLADVVRLLKEAGYGAPEPEPNEGLMEAA